MSDEIEAKIHPGSDGKFWAEVIGCPGCYSQGDNYSKILASLRDAHELWSGGPAAAAGAEAPAAVTIELAEGASVADLIAAIEAEGWSATEHASAGNQLWQQTASGCCLCMPVEGAELLNSGYREAVVKFLAGVVG